MALLTGEDLENLSIQLEENDAVVKKVTDVDIKGICESLYGTKLGSEKVGIIPITAGNGVIDNFASSLLFIVNSD